MFTTIQNQLIQSNGNSYLINNINREQTETQSKRHPFAFVEELYSHEIEKVEEPEEVSFMEWEHGGKTGFSLYPTTQNKTHLLNFLAEAHSHMTTFLHKHLKNGPIKCKFTLEMLFKNESNNDANIQFVPTAGNSYADIFELSGFIHQIHAVYQHYIIEHCTTNEGYEFDEIGSIEIQIL